jgi:alcohol dehydrogenase YqhD (iron-dependent ADH family)
MNFENPLETAHRGISAFRKFLRSIGMPINFEELGAKEEDIPLLVEKFGLVDGKTGGFVQLSSDDVAEILRIAAHAEI